MQSLNSKSVPSAARASASRKAIVTRAYLEEKQAARPSRGGRPYPYANQLEALRSMSVVVADTGELDLVRKYKPQDCTTNPSLVYKAIQVPGQRHFLDQALTQKGAASHDPSRPYAGVADVLAVNLGCELLKLIPGRVSTEVDAHLSYDTKATVDKALRLVDLYAARGVDTKRLYIKIASTWEGIEACRTLEKQGINTNMTLLFSFAQAAACADAGATLISPFVGRILDWYKAKYARDYKPNEDPGVLSVKRIYEYYKIYQYPTIIMAASFRNVGEILELAGCDNITISPALLAELEAATEPIQRKLDPTLSSIDVMQMSHFTCEQFERLHATDQCGVDKLKEGIDSFAADQRKLEATLAELAGSSRK